MDKKKLTTKQQRFVDFYDGNATEACRKAGYKGSNHTLEQVAYENLRKPEIVSAIESRERLSKEKVIMDRESRQELWTMIALDKEERTDTRLRASELLGKSEGDFIDRHELSGSIAIEEYKRDIKEKVDALIRSTFYKNWKHYYYLDNNIGISILFTST